MKSHHSEMNPGLRSSLSSAPAPASATAVIEGPLVNEVSPSIRDYRSAPLGS